MQSSAKWGLLIGSCVLLCLIFLVRLAYLLLQGEGIPTDDSLLNAILIGKLLNGGYAWSHLFRDVYTNGHFNFFPILAQYLWALLTGWNFRLALFLGAALALVKIYLLHSALARPKDRLLSWLLWPCLFGLTLAVTAMDVFQLDSSSFQLGLNHLGLIFGIWALARFPGEWRAVLGACLGGWLATWSWGSGAMAWPTFFLGMALLGFRKPAQYAVLLIVGGFCVMPYLVLLLLAPVSGQEPKLLALFNFPLVVQSLGLLFAQAYSPEMAWWRGLAGLGLAAVGLAMALGRQMDLRRLAVPAMLLFYVALHFYQVSLFRNRLMPWYAYQASLFWIGLLGLAYQLLLEKRGRWWAGLLALSMGYFYATSNLTWQDKVASLRHQGPASAACLRHYRSAPQADCEELLFRWKPFENFREMAAALERHGLALFGRRQELSLQGEMVLGRIDASGLRWLKDGHEEAYTDFRRLVLEVPPGGKLEWPVELPEGLHRAELRYERWTSGGSWEKFRSDLRPIAGKRTKIDLAPGLYRFPSIVVEK